MRMYGYGSVGEFHEDDFGGFDGVGGGKGEM